jgi:hypothetical protein
MIIYKATNIITGQCYIGQSVNFASRKKVHIRRALKNEDTWVFHRAIRKHGADNFKWETIYECDDKLTLNVMETFKIMVNHSHMSEGGYNMTWGGDGISGYKHTDESKKKISDRMAGDNNPMHGHIYTDEEKQHISECTKNGITPEECKKRSERTIGKRNPIYGRKRTDDEKSLMSKNRKGKLIGKDNPAYKSAPEYLITFPDGHQEIVKGLKTFCRDNNLSRYIMNNKPKTIGYNVKRLYT